MKNWMMAAVAAVAMTIGMQPGIASATGTGNPVVTAPADGATVANGYDGPISVDFSGAPEGTYYGELECNDYAYAESQNFSYDGTLDEQTWQIPSITGPASCNLSIDNYNGNAVMTTFTVAAPPPPALVVDAVSINHTTFYPLVHDNYFDTTTIYYHLNRSAKVYARARTSTGTVVRFVSLGDQSAGRRYWTWNGRKQNGSLASTGAYHLEITAIADRSRVVSKGTTIATGWRTKTVKRYRTGDAPTSYARTSSCYVDFNSYDTTVDLDCWGGSYALANYGFGLPSNAYNVSAYVNGYQGCCDHGSISRSGRRVSSTGYRITVKVTDWRSYTINYVRVMYTYKYRV